MDEDGRLPPADLGGEGAAEEIRTTSREGRLLGGGARDPLVGRFSVSSC